MKSKDILTPAITREFAQRILNTISKYDGLIIEEEKKEKPDRNNIAIWEQRQNDLYKELHNIEMLEFSLFV